MKFPSLLKLFGRDRSSNNHDSSSKRLQIFLTSAVVDNTSVALTSFGTETVPHEGIVYWAGLALDDLWMITSVITPHATTTSGSYHTSVSANVRMIQYLSKFNLHLLAQVHSHPSGWVGHSEGDHQGAFMPYEGFLSVVVPWYGRNGLLPLEICGIHQYKTGRFIRLLEAEIQDNFHVLPDNVDLRLNL